MRRPVAAVIGGGEATPAELADADALGRALIQAGFRVLTGGLGGVMEAASRGARSAPEHRDGDVLAVLPGYDAEAANAHADVVLCTGLGHARNVLVVASADVVLAVGGRAGTLSEIALAWTLGKPVIAVGASGWAGRVAGEVIDDRKAEPVHGPCTPREAATLARDVLTRAG